MKVYIAASNYYKALGFATLLKKKLRAKIEFVSTWHNPEYNTSPELRLTDLEKVDRAETNLGDLRLADVLIMMDDYDNVPGGKHFELGYAFALDKRVIVLGRREHGYTRHSDVLNATTFEELVGILKGL